MDSVRVDAHVHFHETDPVADWMEHAFAQADQCGLPLFLLCADPAGEEGYARLRDAAASQRELSFREAGEPESFVIERVGRELVVCRGRQWVSKEGIEVLHLLSAGESDEARWASGEEPLSALLSELSARPGVVVLPWGFGKWLGARGRVVTAEIRRSVEAGHPIFLGDIRARCWPWRSPTTRAPGVPVLPGSDPLPIDGGFREIGRYGFRVQLGEWRARPAARLREVLRGGAAVEIVGRPQSAVVAVTDQLRYRRRPR